MKKDRQKNRMKKLVLNKETLKLLAWDELRLPVAGISLASACYPGQRRPLCPVDITDFDCERTENSPCL
jgi:hypothetical protein